MQFEIRSPKQAISARIQLDGSKSISNRVLIIQQLCNDSFDIQNLSQSDDTRSLQFALKMRPQLIDVGAAGTTMRFLTAYLATQNDKYILTGSARMKKRPIGVLVSALRSVGGQIHYLEQEGYPPLQIEGHTVVGGKISMPAHVSSQYISALLMIAPTLERGLEIELVGELVSRPYLLMTLRIMERFGVQHTWKSNVIRVWPQNYQAPASKTFVVEADWSAASYYYSIAALCNAQQFDYLQLVGLQANSLQGDSCLLEIMQHFGVNSHFEGEVLHLTQKSRSIAPFVYDFLECPDIAQTLAVVCAGLRIPARFRGLQTLSIKETDRTAALRQELAKIGISFQVSKQEPDTWLLNPALPNKTLEKSNPVVIDTYHDHRMAMSFAPLALRHAPLCINDPMVVTKSYPQFWHDWERVGFSVTKRIMN